MKLIATLRPAAPSITLIDLQGDLNAQAEEALMEAQRQATAAGARALILNFSAVSQVNSAGVGQLMMLLARARRQGQRWLACGLTDPHRQIFTLTRLDEVIEVYARETEAVAAASATTGASGVPGGASRPQRLAAWQPLAGQPGATGWAVPVSRLAVTEIPAGVANLNVHGRQLTGPIRGFGPLWKKTYEIRLTGATATPREVIQVWKDNFGSFWPKGNRFYGRPVGLVPGDVAVLHLAGPGGLNPPGGLPLIATGLMVIYVDEDSFAFMASAGHTIAGMITFTALEDQGVVVRIEALFRAADPFFELMFRLGLGNLMENTFWKQILRNLARRFGAHGEPRLTAVCVDPGLQWAEARNIWQNAAIHTSFYILGAPFRWAGGLFRRQPPAPPGKG